MLPPNYQQKRVMDSMLRDYRVGKHFGLDKTKSALMDVMVKHKVTTDPSKLAGYKKEAFLKDVNKLDLSVEGKRAMQEIYGPPKRQAAPLNQSNVSQSASHQSSGMNLGNSNARQDQPQQTKNIWLSALGFGSNKNIRQAQQNNVIVPAQYKKAEEDIDEIKARINGIQS